MHLFVALKVVINRKVLNGGGVFAQNEQLFCLVRVFASNKVRKTHFMQQVHATGL